MSLSAPLATAATAEARLKYLAPGWFGIVMGWCGLALAWHRAADVVGATAPGVAAVAGGVALLAFVLLALLSVLRARRHPQALREDLHHPVRHAFVAGVPISLLLLAALAVAGFGPGTPGLALLWWIASLSQLGVTLWVLSRWLRASPAAGGPAWQWAGVTPALFIPIVGNVLVPLAGVPLGFAPWAAAQFGIGLLFWPVVMILFFVRLGQAGPLPAPLLPTVFIHIAPPAVVGMALLQFDAPALWAWALWGMALFLAMWALTLTRRLLALPFGVPHWAMSFPLAALAVLTLRLASTDAGRWLAMPAIALLAMVSLVVVGLSLATLRGLRGGTLPGPEAPPASTLNPIARAP